jgi:enoyl-CoA hydratase/carnithine racemase
MTVGFSVENRVARVTLDRPDRMNAVDAETERELDAIWSEIESRDDISCVVLTGSGQKAFCTGADLKGGATKSVASNIGRKAVPTGSAASPSANRSTCR